VTLTGGTGILPHSWGPSSVGYHNSGFDMSIPVQLEPVPDRVKEILADALRTAFRAEYKLQRESRGKTQSQGADLGSGSVAQIPHVVNSHVSGVPPNKRLEAAGINILMAVLIWLFTCALCYVYGASVFRAKLPYESRDYSELTEVLRDADRVLAQLPMRFKWVARSLRAEYDSVLRDCETSLVRQHSHMVIIESDSCAHDKQVGSKNEMKGATLDDGFLATIEFSDGDNLSGMSWVPHWKASPVDGFVLDVPEELLKTASSQCPSPLSAALDALVRFLSSVSDMETPLMNASTTTPKQTKDTAVEYTISLKLVQLSLDSALLSIPERNLTLAFHHTPQQPTSSVDLELLQSRLMHGVRASLQPFLQRLDKLYKVRLLTDIRSDVTLTNDPLVAGLLPAMNPESEATKRKPQYEVASIDALLEKSDAGSGASIPSIFHGGIEQCQELCPQRATNSSHSKEVLRFIGVDETLLRPLAGSAAWFLEDSQPSSEPIVNIVALFPPNIEKPGLAPCETPESSGFSPPFVAIRSHDDGQQIGSSGWITQADVKKARELASTLYCAGFVWERASSDKQASERLQTAYGDLLKHNGLAVPAWGSLLLLPWPLVTSPAKNEGTIQPNLSVIGPVIVSALLSHLRTFFGLPHSGAHNLTGFDILNQTYPVIVINSPEAVEGLAPWEERLLTYALTRRQIKVTTEYLQSLYRLLDQFPHVPVPNDVGEEVLHAVEQLQRLATQAKTLNSWRSNRDGQGETLVSEIKEAAQNALTSAKAALFHQDMIPQLYFPDEHLYAVFAPLMAPILVPVITILLKVVSQWRMSKAELHRGSGASINLQE